MKRYKFKVGEEVYVQTGWYPSFKFKIIGRYLHKHITDGSLHPMYSLKDNLDFINAERSLRGKIPRISPIAENFLSKEPFNYQV